MTMLAYEANSEPSFLIGTTRLTRPLMSTALRKRFLASKFMFKRNDNVLVTLLDFATDANVSGLRATS